MSFWLSSWDVAIELRLPLRGVWKLVEDKQLTPITLPWGWRFLASDVHQLQHRGVS
jgi:hypothetical protein